MKALRKALCRVQRLMRRRLTYAEEKSVARHRDTKVRARLAAREDVRPEILYYLAGDPAPEVRREIAANVKTPSHADLILARDTDDDVRCDLAQKIARLAPGLSADEQDRVRRITYLVLEILARDQVSKVRQILAETLKDVADAPPEIIGTLARDAEIVVAGPVLRHSPVLTDEDLLEIIRSCPVDGALTAISSRPYVAAQVSDAVVEADDVEAVAALLANPSAQIREVTLDRIIDRAPDIEAWHEPLARVPKLSSEAVRRMTRFMADSLLEVLQARGDLDPETTEAVRVEVRHRLDGAAEGGSGALAGDEASSGGEMPIDRARRLKLESGLDEKAVTEALTTGDRAFVAAALAVLSDQPPALVEKIAESKSAKGITALCWKAGLSARFATQLQSRFAHIAPSAVLLPRDGDAYPLTPEDMNWQMEFFGSMVPASPMQP
jgi:uncharacterized protein (DUF2336 family)